MWILVLLGLVIAGVVIAARQSSGALPPAGDDDVPPDEMPPPSSESGAQLASRRFSAYELGVLTAAAGRYGIERLFLISLAAIENGPVVPSAEGTTRGLGMLPKAKYPTFEQQASGSALTIANHVRSYEENLGRSAYEGSHYSPEFIAYFSQGGPGYDGYARVGVLNDPTNLNANHLRNLTNAYAAVVTGSVVV